VGGHGRYAEARADVETRGCGQAYHSGGGQVGVLLGCAGGPLVAGEVYPDPITDGKVFDTLTDCVNDTRTVLVWGHLWKRRRGTGAGANAGLPVGGVDAGDNHTDTDLAGRRFGHIPIDEAKNRRVTSA